jgi:hypothetical protein
MAKEDKSGEFAIQTREDVTALIAKALQLPSEHWTEEAIKWLGRAVISWSYLETTLDTLFEVLLAIHGFKKTQSLKIMSANVDMRDKLQIIQALTVDCVQDKKTVGEAVSLTNYVGNELRNERNRLFHDNWSKGFAGSLLRTRRQGSKVSRPQAREFELVLPKAEPAGSKEIQQFNTNCTDAAMRALSLGSTLLANWTSKSGE